MTAYPSIDQKVICIRDDWQDSSPLKLKGAVLPVKGQIYTIIRISMEAKGPFLLFREVPVLQVVEGKNGELWWFAESFKPIDDSKLDQFRALLNPKEEEAKHLVNADKRRFEPV
jgi:hypothetical protein